MTDNQPYLGTFIVDGVLCHRWLDGTSLRVLAGSADDDETDDETDDEDEDEEDDEDDKKPATRSKSRAHRQAARFRIAAKTERTRADAAEERATAAEQRERALLVEMAFTRAAGDRFADADAAWKLVDKSLIKIGDDGKVTGADEAIAALIESHPFVALADDDEEDDDDNKRTKDRNPFNSSGKPMRRGNRNPSAPTEAALAQKYPALRNRR